MRRTKFHIPAGTETTVQIRVAHQGVQHRRRVTEEDVTYTEQDVKAKYPWAVEFYLPDEMHPYETIGVDWEFITVEDE